ncbi:MAG: peptide deformylase [Candidatus Aureabacteria bacterium]|nr:peptide deformylase [Candidatus Auribacterota bacterium]
MAVRKIILVPHPILREKCTPVRNFSSAAIVAEDLRDTLYAHPGCVGIASQQIGTPERIIAIDASRRKGVVAHGFMVLCNPEVLYREGREIGREGCLSLPDYTANVARATTVVVRARDLEGREMELTARGFEAVVLQHEIDHLEGILFIDRVANVKTDLFRRKKYL